MDRISNYPDEYSKESFHQIHYRMGTLALISNLKNYNSEEMFQIYKSRNEVEQLFDVFKNILKADKTYMHNIDAVKGWLFINHMAIMAYYRIYKLLKEKELLNKISVEDIVTHLVHINMVKIDRSWIMQEVPEKTRKLLKKCNLDLPIT